MKKIFFLIILVIGCGTFFYFYNKNVFIDLGYSKDEVKIIEQVLNNEDQNVLDDYDYDSNYIKLLQNKEFKNTNLKTYIDFIKKFNLSIDNTIFIINNNYNNLANYDENTLLLMKEQYYIHKNIDRYLDYLNKKNISLKDTITNVNSNIDYDFYTNTVDSDLSKKYLILVNKFNYLNKDYVPENLVSIESNYGITGYLESDTYTSFKKMADDASTSNVNLYAYSPYRSYSVQYSLYNRYASKDGIKLADTYSARAGYSEHQTGLAVDISRKGGNLNGFENTNEFKWLENNCYKYGFIIRYPKDKEYITGYQYEPWHYRYVGIDVATKIHDENITFEEYYAYYVK